MDITSDHIFLHSFMYFLFVNIMKNTQNSLLSVAVYSVDINVQTTTPELLCYCKKHKNIKILNEVLQPRFFFECAEVYSG